MMSIQDMYVQSYNIQPHGVQGYHVDNKYTDSRQSESKVPKKQLKRGSYLQDYGKIHNSIPGPGVYDYAKDEWPKKSRSRQEKGRKKMTYIEEIMKKCRKEKTPAPGQYKLGKSLKEMDEERKKNRYTKVKQQDRMTYLDAVQYEAAQIPGVGKYNTKVRPKSSHIPRGENPQDWRKKHAQQSKTKKKPKRPDMCTYNPQQAKSYTRKNLKEGDWNRVERFKTEKTGSSIGPGKYIALKQWTKKQVSSHPYKSTYYH